MRLAGLLGLRRPPRWSLSLLMLVAVNAAPAAAVLVFRWSAADLVILYWTENLIIGGYNVLRLLLVRMPERSGHLGKLLSVPFFVVHFGIFCTVHGMFLLFFFKLGGAPGGLPLRMSGTGPAALFSLPATLLRTLWTDPPAGFAWVMIGLVASHGVSFVQNYLLGGERNVATLNELMAQPYRRIAVLHVAIIAGGLLIVFLDSPAPLLLILVLAKIVLDVALHQREHRRFASSRVRAPAPG